MKDEALHCKMADLMFDVRDGKKTPEDAVADIEAEFIRNCPFSKEQQDIMFNALNRYGAEKQIVKAIEEMGELAVEFSRYLNGDNSNFRQQHIREEIADVGIMIWQMAKLFDNIGSYANWKLTRLQERVRNGL